MKKLFYTASLLIASGFISLYAGEAKCGITELRKNISKKISVPENLRKANMKEFVLVSITVNADGRIEVTGMNAANKELGDHVAEQLNKMTLKGKVDAGQTYNMRLEFKVL